MNRKIFVTAVILTATTFWLSAQDIIITKDIASILYQDGDEETFISAVSSFAPVGVGEPLTYKGGVRQNGIKLKPYKVKVMMRENYDALYNYRSGRGWRTTGIAVSGIGSLVFAQWVYEKVNGYSSPEYFWPGILCIASGLSCIYIGQSNIKESVIIYNSKLSGYSTVPFQINFGLTQSGVGLTMRF